MRLMLDLNVLLDVVQRREPFYAASAGVLSRLVEGKASGCLASYGVTTLHYIVRRHSGAERADELLDWLLAHIEIVAQDRAQLVRAKSLAFSDFEDAVLASAAEASACDRIVTRNVADFSRSPIPAVTPEELLTLELEDLRAFEERS